jgi:hypothetical protein
MPWIQSSAPQKINKTGTERDGLKEDKRWERKIHYCKQ